jgi:AP-1-like transcription factor
MAGTTTGDFPNGGSFYMDPNQLDPNQQDLLLAALSSNNQHANDIFAGLDNNTKAAINGQQFQYPADGSFDGSYDGNGNFFTSPQQSTPATTFNNIGVEESPFIEFDDGNFDFDGADNGDLMIGALPGDSPTEGAEKRKSPGDDGDDPDGGGKRREGEDKQAKKPGRKPLTSEPTTVRFLSSDDFKRAY